MDNFHLEERIRRRLIFFPLPLQGHITPILHLASILHSKGFSITILHLKLNPPNPAHHPHFTFRLLDDDAFSEEAFNADLVSFLAILNDKCAEPLKQALAELVADAATACLISDAIFHFTTGVCESLRLPRVVLRTGGVCSFLAFAAFPLLLQKGYLPLQDDRLEEAVIELPPLRIKDLPVINTPHQDKLYELVQQMVQQTKASSGLIWNSFQELEETSIEKLHQDFQIPIFPIDKQTPKSVIYVSFGSIATIDEAEFLEVAWGLANTKHPFLWVVRPGLARGAEWLEILPGGFLDGLNGRGHIVKWAPQVEVLAHPSVGVFWTHCGWNSTLESICEGVPMMCTPCFTDQRVNARYVGHVWKVGEHLEKELSRERIERAVGRLMEGREGEEIRERALFYKEVANVCVRPGGSSYDSLSKLVKYLSFT
ncbi:UDP-glycosyltransferase 76F1-like isoform X2 [Salvia splendens]|uniref:UDP-glycosyltransferase 76F1-like isoform X2 n=1 Tax=Salvia splendens TaxID=180675 RepID=UPI001C2520CD|nr:UDP-glycosyltransferase 76F1-like isoform X2 [Salvia splendens]